MRLLSQEINNSQKATFVWFVVLFCIAALFATAYFSPTGWDSYWHLRMGMDLVENGLSPFQDHYSFTYNGSHIEGPPVIFEVIYYSLYALFNDPGGAIAFKFLAFLIILACMLRWLRNVKANWGIYAIVLTSMVAVLQYRSMVRPELLTYAFSVAALILYRRAGCQINPRSMAPILLLMFLWANYHSAVLGYVIFFGLFLDAGISLLGQKASRNEWLSWLGWGLLIVAIGFLNYSFTHPVIGQLRFSNEWKQLIVEYVFPMKYLYNWSTLMIIGIAIVTLFLAVRQKRVGYIVIIMVLTHSAMTMSRMVALASLIILVIFADVSASRSILKTTERRSRSLTIAMSATVLFVTVFMGYLTIRTVDTFTKWRGNIGTYLPADLVNYMLEEKKAGTIFNQYRVGGYLLFKLHPQNKVYIDGRTNILYPLEHMQRYDQAVSSLSTMFEEVDRWEFDYAVLLNKPRYMQFMFYSGYGLEFADQDFSLYSRKNSRLPLLGKLIAAPYCWDNSNTSAVLKEINEARTFHKPTSFVASLADLIEDYINAPDKAELIRSYDRQSLSSDASRRFFVYRALTHEQYDLAIEVMGELSDWQYKDTLTIAYAFIAKRDFQSAAAPIGQSTTAKRNEIQLIDLVVQEALLAAYAESVNLQTEDSAYLESITKELGSKTLAASGKALSADMFCEAELRAFNIDN